MIAHLIPAEFLAVADALAGTTGTPGAEPELLALNRYKSLTKGPRKSPCVVFHVEPQKQYRTACKALLHITVESVAGDDGKADPDNHASRVALVDRLFSDEKTARIAAIAARGQIIVTDYGKVPGQLLAESDTSGEKLRSVLSFLIVAKKVPAG